MIKTTYICDKCQKESANDNDFETIHIHRNEDYRHKTTLLLCPECALRLGLVETKNDSVVWSDTTAERLYNIVAEVADEIINP